MARRTVVSMPGDGIGKVVLPEAVRVLDAVGFEADYEELEADLQEFSEKFAEHCKGRELEGVRFSVPGAVVRRCRVSGRPSKDDESSSICRVWS